MRRNCCDGSAERVDRLPELLEQACGSARSEEATRAQPQHPARTDERNQHRCCADEQRFRTDPADRVQNVIDPAQALMDHTDVVGERGTLRSGAQPQ